MQLLEFKPLYMERVWGGRAFEAKLGRKLPKGKVIGESWEIVDRDDDQSTVADGPLAGQTLRELLEHSGAEIMGPESDPQKPFPILVKWLDCRERLSLQVHPPAEIADKLKGEPKTENWYIADADENASIIAGLRPGVTRESFERSLAQGKVEDDVQFLPTANGDSIFVESGCVHAISSGNLILEIQQNSDTTYRVYDWNRMGLDGTPRKLHIQESLQSINFNMPGANLLKPDTGEQTLADCNEFRIRKFDLAPGDAALPFPSNEQTRLIHVISGSLRDQVSGKILHSSRNYLQPFVTDLSLVAETETTLLITDQFVV
ncbi:MAG: mannose-6-phosphate isomerase [Lentimonas sp.]|jgi:mannose-6-phosphate isomerase